MVVTFEDWTKGRAVRSFGTNSGAEQLPFQKWRNFKEAFAPELVDLAISNSRIPVRRCLDPFGGSGTTALSCQFRGVHPVTVEVNPFLADLIRAKLNTYDCDRLAEDLGVVVKNFERSRRSASTLFAHVPETFVEPGRDQRWVFDRDVADGLAKLLAAIEKTAKSEHRRFFRVMLGGILVELSNVVVSGKGRRYRRNWQERRADAEQTILEFCEICQNAIAELRTYVDRACASYEVRRGDARRLPTFDAPFDLAVFSPPYPNSFDYTDIYNIELWMLGYLSRWEQNKKLRTSTLSSHVQVGRKFSLPPEGSATLDRALKRLKIIRRDLWDPRIPDMIGSYFHELISILKSVAHQMNQRGEVWLVVGDSRYADVSVPTAKILSELTASTGLITQSNEKCRSMRASAQQGGQRVLHESLLILSKP